MQIRNVLRATLIMAALSTAAVAQSGTSSGVKLGLNSATQQSELYDLLTVFGAEQTARVGLAAGVFAELPLNHTFSLQPELLYAMKGTSISAGDLLEEGDEEVADYKFDYLEIPVLAKATFGGGNTHPFAYAGPAFGVLLSAKASDSVSEEDIKEDFKMLDVGFGLGGGVAFGAIGVEARFIFGLSDISNLAESDSEGFDFSVTNAALSLMLSYKF